MSDNAQRGRAHFSYTDIECSYFIWNGVNPIDISIEFLGDIKPQFFTPLGDGSYLVKGAYKIYRLTAIFPLVGLEENKIAFEVSVFDFEKGM